MDRYPYGLAPTPTDSYTYATDTPLAPWGTSDTSTSMYLFTFLATGAVLVSIAIILIARAALARRRYLRQLHAAVARGDTVLPVYQNPFFAPRPENPANRTPRVLPPIPKMWEDVMVLEDNQGVGPVDKKEDKWEWLVPLSTIHVLPYDAAPPPRPVPPHLPRLPSMGQEFGTALRAMFPRRRSRNPAARTGTAVDKPLMETPIVAEAPPAGSELLVGVLIAMPTNGDEWTSATGEEGEENEVPEVCVGVMECWVIEKGEKVEVEVVREVEVEVVREGKEEAEGRAVVVVDKWAAQ